MTRIALPSGLALAVHEWPGPGPLVLLHHGTGFCGSTWCMVAERLAARFHVIALDARNHGASDKPGGDFGWPTFFDDARDLARCLLERAGARDFALAVGHSFGGAVVLRVAQRDPALFRAVVAVDPVLLTADRYARRGLRADGTHPLSIATRMRRASFASRDAAREALRATRTFSTWQPAVLDAYVRDGFADVPEGGVRLQCAPDVEARMFEMGGNQHCFEGPPLAVPALVQRATGGWFTPEEYAQFRPAFPGAIFEDVESGHLVPMEDPPAVAARILAFAESLGV